MYWQDRFGLENPACIIWYVCMCLSSPRRMNLEAFKKMSMNNLNKIESIDFIETDLPIKHSGPSAFLTDIHSPTPTPCI